MAEISKLQRQLDLIAHLVGRRVPATVEELMDKIPGYARNWRLGTEKGTGAARMAFERDKKDLRDFGIPLKTVKYTFETEEVEGYAIQRRDFYLPYLKLVSQLSGTTSFPSTAKPATVEITREQAPLALRALNRVAEIPNFPLAAEAKSAFRKLAFDLDPARFAQEPGVLFADAPSNTEEATTVQTVSRALLRRKTISFQYRGIHRGEETAREVNVHGMLCQSGQWYVVAYDLGRKDMRIFRAGRMSDVQVSKRNPNSPHYTIPDDFHLDTYAGKQPWELGDQDEEPVEARVLFRFPLSLWAERNNHGTLEATNADGSSIRVFVVRQANPFLRWLLGMQTEVDVIDPPELAAELRTIAARVATANSSEAVI